MTNYEKVEELQFQFEALIESRCSPEEKVLLISKYQDVVKAIQSIPKQSKESFLMYLFENLSYRQISETTGKSLNSVRSDIHRARQTIKDKVKEYDQLKYYDQLRKS